MKTMLKYLTTLALVVGITLATPQSLFAKGRGGSRGGSKVKPPEPPSPTTISAISDSSITVASKGGSRSYTISKNPTIRVNGYTAPLSSVQAGMRVMVGTNSSGEASSIAVSGAPGKATSKKKR